MRRAITLLLLILLSIFWPSSSIEAANGSLYLSPSSGVYSVGNTFSLDIRINTDGVAINAAEGGIIFSSDKLEVVSISKSGSIFSLWTTEPIFSNSAGTIDFGGGLPNPGYTGASGKIVSVTFKAKIAGIASVSFSSGAVLANDGKGTNILASLGSGSYTLQTGAVAPSTPSPTPTPTPTPTPILTPTPTNVPPAPVITSVTELGPDNWTNHNSPEFKWDLPSDVTDVSIMLTDKPNSNPGPYSDGLFDSKAYEDLEDGIHYLHLKLKNRSGWSQITHFKIQIDTQPPLPFEITVKEGAETDNPQPTLYFETTDQLSGLAYYEVITGEDDSVRLNLEEIRHNPYQMPPQAPGKHTAVVKAVDKAKNSTLAMATVNILPIESPTITDYPQHLLPGDILAFKGNTFPESTVVVYVQQKGEEPDIQVIKSDKYGQWSYVYDQPVEKGIYKIWAQTIDEREAQSLPSEKMTISVRRPIFLRIGDLIVEHLTIAISLLTFLALLVLSFFYFWWRIKLFFKKLRKETKEAEQALHRAFDALREDAEGELKLLDKVKSKRDLTKEEEKIRKNLRKNLNMAEKFIEKEIKDIENIKNQLKIKEWIKKYFK